jgi:Spy/CpxP family protein refolding chaperone
VTRCILTQALGLALSATLTAMAPLAAQQPQHAPPGQLHPGSMMTTMPGPAMIVMHREQLGLSDAQVRRLEILAAEQQQVIQPLMQQSQRVMAELMQAVSGEIDVEAARETHDRLARIHTQMLVATLEATKAARQVLTPEQGVRWDALVSQMGGMMGMMMPMMMGPSMMHPDGAAMMHPHMHDHGNHHP